MYAFSEAMDFTILPVSTTIFDGVLKRVEIPLCLDLSGQRAYYSNLEPRVSELQT